MPLGFLLTACADYDCVNQGYAYQPARQWRGASAERPPAAWGEQDRLVALRDDATLTEAWTRFDLEAELGYPAPSLDLGALIRSQQHHRVLPSEPRPARRPGAASRRLRAPGPLRRDRGSHRADALPLHQRRPLLHDARIDGAAMATHPLLEQRDRDQAIALNRLISPHFQIANRTG